MIILSELNTVVSNYIIPGLWCAQVHLIQGICDEQAFTLGQSFFISSYGDGL